MKVTVKDYLNVRVGRPSVNAPTFQYLAPGSELDVDGQLYKGDFFEGVDTWLKDEGGNYYWSGGLNHSISVKDFLDLSKPISDDKIRFDWFNQLKIETVWNQFNERGSRVKVAILDTGYNSFNSEIASKITNSSILIKSKDYPGIKLIVDDQSNDCHGTRCASLIGARNNKDWIIGIAPECEMIVGKISIDTEIMDFNYIMDGVKWALSQNVDIISVSYAFEDLKESEIVALNKKLQEMVANKNTLIFAAAGNSGAVQRSANLYPASFDDCISVGASGSGNTISPITVLSSKTIIHAPGEKIESYNKLNIPTPESGTSFATPIVAGISALAISFLKKRDNNSWDKKELLRKIYATGDSIINDANKKVINPLNLFNNL